jgi:hypothetical protein
MFKAVTITGSAIGAIASIVIALSMDAVYKDSLGGSWRGAIAKDLHTFLGVNSPETSLLVLALFIFTLIVLGAFGSVVGLMFSFFVYKFLDMLQRK